MGNNGENRDEKAIVEAADFLNGKEFSHKKGDLRHDGAEAVITIDLGWNKVGETFSVYVACYLRGEGSPEWRKISLTVQGEKRDGTTCGDRSSPLFNGKAEFKNLPLGNYRITAGIMG